MSAKRDKLLAGLSAMSARESVAPDPAAGVSAGGEQKKTAEIGSRISSEVQEDDDKILEQIHMLQERIYAVTADMERYDLLQRRVAQSLSMSSVLRSDGSAFQRTLFENALRLRDDRASSAASLGSDVQQLEQQYFALRSRMLSLGRDNRMLASEILQHTSGSFVASNTEAEFSEADRKTKILQDRVDLLRGVLRSLIAASAVQWHAVPELRAVMFS